MREQVDRQRRGEGEQPEGENAAVLFLLQDITDKPEGQKRERGVTVRHQKPVRTGIAIADLKNERSERQRRRDKKQREAQPFSRAQFSDEHADRDQREKTCQRDRAVDIQQVFDLFRVGRVARGGKLIFRVVENFRHGIKNIVQPASDADRDHDDRSRDSGGQGENVENAPVENKIIFGKHGAAAFFQDHAKNREYGKQKIRKCERGLAEHGAA